MRIDAFYLQRKAAQPRQVIATLGRTDITVTDPAFRFARARIYRLQRRLAAARREGRDTEALEQRLAETREALSRSESEPTEDETGSGFDLPSILSTHPGDAERAAAARARAGRGDAGLTQTEWQALRSICSNQSE